MLQLMRRAWRGAVPGAGHEPRARCVTSAINNEQLPFKLVAASPVLLLAHY